jgi:hypothetical protein
MAGSVGMSSGKTFGIWSVDARAVYPPVDPILGQDYPAHGFDEIPWVREGKRIQ